MILTQDGLSKLVGLVCLQCGHTVYELEPLVAAATSLYARQPRFAIKGVGK